MENLQEKNTKEIIQLYSKAIKELKRRKVIRTNNVVGELGEYFAIEIYNNTPGLPNLAPAPVGTENIDAISRKGDRYSIKSTSNTTTGVFYGLEEPESDVLEMDWDTFLRNKRWYKRMHAWNLSLSKKLFQRCKVIYEKEE